MRCKGIGGKSLHGERRKGEILQQLQVLDRIAKALSLSFYGKGGTHLETKQGLAVVKCLVGR